LFAFDVAEFQQSFDTCHIMKYVSIISILIQSVLVIVCADYGVQTNKTFTASSVEIQLQCPANRTSDYFCVWEIPQLLSDFNSKNSIWLCENGNLTLSRLCEETDCCQIESDKRVCVPTNISTNGFQTNQQQDIQSKVENHDDDKTNNTAYPATENKENTENSNLRSAITPNEEIGALKLL